MNSTLVGSILHLPQHGGLIGTIDLHSGANSVLSIGTISCIQPNLFDILDTVWPEEMALPHCVTGPVYVATADFQETEHWEYRHIASLYSAYPR
jgi:hypothetical protein